MWLGVVWWLKGPYSPMMLCAFLDGLPLKRVLPLELITCENADQLVVFLCHPCAFGHVKISKSISAQEILGVGTRFSRMMLK